MEKEVKMICKKMANWRKSSRSNIYIIGVPTEEYHSKRPEQAVNFSEIKKDLKLGIGGINHIPENIN